MVENKRLTESARANYILSITRNYGIKREG